MNHRRSRKAFMPLVGGSESGYSFYEPDKKLSDQLNFGGKKALTTEIVTRELVWDYYRVLGYLPNPEKILRKMNKDVEVYDELLSDARVKASFNSRRAGTLSLNWDIDQAGCPVRQFKMIKSVFDSFPMYDIISEVLKCAFYGYQPLEVLWKKVGSNILPENLVPKSQRWFRYSDINELRFLTKRNMITGEPLPERKFIVARHHPSYDNPYGEALGAAIYWPVKFRHTGFRFYTSFVEKYGTPWIKASYPLGTREARVAEMLDVLTKTMQDGVVAFPQEMQVEAMPIGGESGSSSIYNQFIELCNQEIYMAILGQNLTSEVSKGGSYAAAKVHGAVRQDIIEQDKRIVEDVFNTLIDWICELNFDSDQRPKFIMTEPLQSTKDDAQMAVYLGQAGATFTKAYFMNKFGLAEEEFDVKSKEELLGTTPAQMGILPGDAQNAVGDNDDDATMKSLAVTKDPTTNPQSHDAVSKLRGKKAYGSYQTPTQRKE